MTGLKIFFAAAFGALIGTITGLQISENSPVAAIIGFLVGGLTGYLSYEFKTVLKTIRDSWRKINWAGIVISMKEGIASLKEGRRSYFWSMLGGFALNMNFVVLIAYLILGFSEKPNAWPDSLFLSYVAFLLSLPLGSGDYNEEKISQCRKLALLGNPLAVYVFWPLYGLWLVIANLGTILRGVCSGLKTVCVETANFFKRIYIAIHSDIRLMLFVDSGLGALIGYLLQAPLIGALAGGILGVLNYYVVALFILGITPKGIERS